MNSNNTEKKFNRKDIFGNWFPKIDYDKYFAIWINATNDVNPCQKIEFLDEDWKIWWIDSFETFFKEAKRAKSKYSNIFNYLRSISENEDSTKFTIFSHTTNVDDIRSWNTKDFIITIVINEWEDGIKYNLWNLLQKEEVIDRLNKQWINHKNIDLYNFWLDWILNWSDDEWYTYLFNSWIWGGSHNIYEDVSIFSEVIRSKWFKIIAPNFLDESNKYTSRTSLFLQKEDWTKYCIRTNAIKSQMDIVKEMIELNQNFISDILVTDKNTLNLQWVWLHSVPSYFSENVLHNVSTVVFNCEDREMWEVIEAVISEAKSFLEDNTLNFKIETKLSNLVNTLMFLKRKLENYNKLMFDKKKTTSDIKNLIIEYKKGWIEKEAEKQNAHIIITNDEIVDLLIKRINVLKEILITLIEETKISEIIKENSKKEEKNNDLLWRVVLITDWWDWSVWSIETNSHEIFFTNSIWNIWEYEKTFFRQLKKKSKWQIDLEINDTTWCGDSSTAAAIMIREENWISIRKEKYKEILTDMWVPWEFFDRAIAIVEAYFLSHLQEVISWVVYHCKKSNLWDIPNSKLISSMILSYVFNNTLKFTKKWMKKIIYSNDNSIDTWKIYNWFNVYKINEL